MIAPAESFLPRPAARPRGVDFGQGLGRIPVHQRQIVIAGVAAVREEPGKGVPTVLQRQPLQCRAHVQAHYRRRILAHCRDLLQYRRRNSLLRVIGKELNRPGSDVRIVVREQFQCGRFIQSAAGKHAHKLRSRRRSNG